MKIYILSIPAAINLFHIKISPVASYGIEKICLFLSFRGLNNLEAVKSRYLKRLSQNYLKVDKCMN
jgi:hypothetical protein